MRIERSIEEIAAESVIAMGVNSLGYTYSTGWIDALHWMVGFESSLRAYAAEGARVRTRSVLAKDLRKGDTLVGDLTGSSVVLTDPVVTGGGVRVHTEHGTLVMDPSVLYPVLDVGRKD